MRYLERVQLLLCDPLAKEHKDCYNNLNFLSCYNGVNRGLNVVSDYYWSSTTNASDSSNAWNVNFNNGNDDWNNKSNSNYVRCVRAGE